MKTVELLGHPWQTYTVGDGRTSVHFEGGKKIDVADSIAEQCEKVNTRTKKPRFSVQALAQKKSKGPRQAELI